MFEKQLTALRKLLLTTKADYAIVGGLAVILFGEPRLTIDIDVNILIDEKKIDFFLSKAKQFGFCPIKTNIKPLIKKTGVIPLKFCKGDEIGYCDLIIAQNSIERIGILRARIRKIGPIYVKVITPEDLVIHKITSERPRDIEDLSGILIRQKGKLDIEYITYWLKKIERANPETKLVKLFKNLLNSH